MSIKSFEVARKFNGQFRVTDLSSAITCPGVGQVVTLQAEGDDLRYRCDGIDPTPEVGMLLPEGESVTLEVDTTKIRVIETTGDGVLNVIVYK
jgi:hypothetical protein